jgi:hypothetical protein
MGDAERGDERDRLRETETREETWIDGGNGAVCPVALLDTRGRAQRAHRLEHVDADARRDLPRVGRLDHGIEMHAHHEIVARRILRGVGRCRVRVRVEHEVVVIERHVRAAAHDDVLAGGLLDVEARAQRSVAHAGEILRAGRVGAERGCDPHFSVVW